MRRKPKPRTMPSVSRRTLNEFVIRRGRSASRRKQRRAEAIAANWNFDYPVGALVELTVRRGDNDCRIRSKTTSRAYGVKGRAVVLVAGMSGAVDLSRITALIVKRTEGRRISR